ncbi:hypothetical protein JKP88DRAFT_254214 [Tribonema minus]|uniref:Uncharacterized protein n=1 Tax=Tribonema minus TaxID=303371 RepID=A0A835ZBA0_9STRA|nr:hypothetical protein JKP88DRAFT_254214 [Tribonema minus]
MDDFGSQHSHCSIDSTSTCSSTGGDVVAALCAQERQQRGMAIMALQTTGTYVKPSKLCRDTSCTNIHQTIARAEFATADVRALLPQLLQAPFVAVTLVEDPSARAPQGWERPPSADVWFTPEQESAMREHGGARLFCQALPPDGSARQFADGQAVVNIFKMLRALVDGAQVDDSTFVVQRGRLVHLDGVHFMISTSDLRSPSGGTLACATVSIPGERRRRKITVAVQMVLSAWLGGVTAAYPKRDKAAYIVTDDLRVEPNNGRQGNGATERG